MRLSRGRLGRLIREALGEVESALGYARLGGWADFHLSRARELLLEALRELGVDGGGW